MTNGHSLGHRMRTLSAAVTRLGSVYRPKSPFPRVSARSGGSWSKKAAAASTDGWSRGAFLMLASNRPVFAVTVSGGVLMTSVMQICSQLARSSP